MKINFGKTVLSLALLACSSFAFADVVLGNCRYPTKGDVIIRGNDVVATPNGGPICGAVSVSGLTANVSNRQTSFNDPGYLENGEIPNGLVDLRFYDPILGKFPARGQTAYVVINAGQYIALEFNSGPAPSLGKTSLGSIEWSDASTNKGPVEVALSTKEGDFNVVSNCRVVHGASAVTWSIGKHPWACVLAPNTTYFVNVRFPDCPFDTCHWFVTSAGKI